jgi:anti-anti-sigma factor
MNLTMDTKNGVMVLRPEVEYLDVSNASDFRQGVKGHLRKGCPVALDLGHVKFVDSAALGAFLSCSREARTLGVTIKLFNLTPPVRSTIQLVRLHRVFHILGDLEETLLSFQSQSNDQADPDVLTD